ncbi:MAG TPA: SDR family NAD(P)-dependent oxidoreductase [Acidimicrobiales bacterium]|nr:SDR family NAD(P)-dependent oxidoreductase [Acidimicrobiales bacterium]
MGFDFNGQRVLVTGASSGIGAELAEALARRGAVLALCARREDRLRETLERCLTHSPDSRMWVCDLAEPDAVEQLAADVTNAFGGVDILVNNAGVPKRRHVKDLDADTVTRVMAINYLSPIRLTLALLPSMLERDYGRIVNISSVAAVLSSPGEAAYDASKAALSSFSEAMAIDLWNTGVKVLVVYPGVIDTELFTIPDNDPLIPGVDSIPASEVGAAVIDALDNDAHQVFVPAYFADFVATKSADLPGFMAGAAEYVKQARQAT